MKRNNFNDYNKLKNIFRGVLCSCVALSLMSFSAPKGKNLPVSDKDKKDEIANPVDPKEGTKNFVSLLPTARPAAIKNTAAKKADISIVKAALNPEARDFVDNYIRCEKGDLTKMKVWGQPIFKLIDAILIQNNLPTQLKYIAVIESNLDKNVRMKSGATGPWQLMPEEGLHYGLIKDGHDYRTDYVESTETAAKIFKSLYSRYGDWLLVFAAYNAGEGRVNKAIAAAGSRDFWKIQYYLPTETRNYVKKFIGTHYFFEGGGGVTTMSANETEKYEQQLSLQNNTAKTDSATAVAVDDSHMARIHGLYNKSVICKILNIDLSVFDKMNPNFDLTLSKGQFYDMHLPDEEKTEEFEQKKDEILQQSFNQLLNDANSVSDSGRN